MSEPAARVIIDPDGDLQLSVGTANRFSRPTIFTCDSKTLSRASKVWKTMLYGPWKESRDASGNQNEWVVELPDDKPKPMTTMLNIMHSRFENLPVIGAQITLDELYELAVLSDKYDLAKMLRPWASSWLQPLRDKYPSGWLYTRQPEMTVDYHQQLWVAWEFGDRTLVENTLQDMILNLNAWQFNGREPPDLLGILYIPEFPFRFVSLILSRSRKSTRSKPEGCGWHVRDDERRRRPASTCTRCDRANITKQMSTQ